MVTERELYALMGEISIKFSNIEFFAGQMLNKLIDADDPLAGNIVTDSMTLGQKLRMMLRLSKHRFPDDPQIDEAVKSMVADIDELREIRNSFTHGHWEIRKDTLAQVFGICCRAGSTEFEGGHERVWTLEDLANINQRAGRLLVKMEKYIAESNGTLEEE